MKNESLKIRLKRGEVCLGTWGFIPSSAVVEIIALSGFDFIVIDMEHSPISLESLIGMITAAENRGMTPIVRVPYLGASPILRVLDSGAHGIQVPHIATRENALDVVKYSKYYPIGSRGMAPNARAGHYTYLNADSSTKLANKQTLIVVNIEGKEGIKNLSSILEVEDIDVVFLGPYDLSQSLGLPGQITHPKVKALIEDSTNKILASGKIPGCFSLNNIQTKYWIQLGIKYITYKADGPIIRNAFERIRKQNNLLANRWSRNG